MNKIHYVMVIGLILTTDIARVISQSYSYSNTASDWKKMGQCSGRKQSPINLGESISNYAKIPRFRIQQNYPTLNDVKLKLVNNGKTMVIELPDSADIRLGIADENFYKGVQLHFHWGRNDSEGSEHTVNGEQYPLEGHFVFYNTEFYENFSQAVSSPTGLAVLGVMFQLSQEDNPLLMELNATISRLIQSSPAEHQLTEGKNLVELFLPFVRESFYRYEGSLTTPPCTENVLWTVFKEAVPVSAGQLRMLRKLNISATESNFNFRNVQELNPSGIPGANRVLYRTFGSRNEPTSAAGIHDTGPLIITCILTIVFIASGKDLI